MKQAGEGNAGGSVWLFDPTRLVPGDVVLEQGSGWVSRVIRIADQGRFSHALLWLGNTDFIEATDGGARVIAFARVQIHDPANWVLLRHPEAEVAARAAREARNLAHKHYDTVGAVSTKIPIRAQPDPCMLFCSQLVAEAYARAGSGLVPGTSSSQVTPNMLALRSALERVSELPVIEQDRGAEQVDRDEAYAGAAPHREMIMSQEVMAALGPGLAALTSRPGSLGELFAALAREGSAASALADDLLSELGARGYFDHFKPALADIQGDLVLKGSPPMFVVNSWRAAADRYAQEGAACRLLEHAIGHPLWTRLAEMYEAFSLGLRAVAHLAEAGHERG